MLLTLMPTLCYTHSPNSNAWIVSSHVQLYGLGQQKRHNIYQYLINTSVEMAIFVLYVGSSVGSLRLKRQEIHCVSPCFFNYPPGNADSPKAV